MKDMIYGKQFLETIAVNSYLSNSECQFDKSIRISRDMSACLLFVFVIGIFGLMQCRNKILSLWNKDVTRVLPLADCGIAFTPADDEPHRASLMRDIYSFLDQSVSSNYWIIITLAFHLFFHHYFHFLLF